MVTLKACIFDLDGVIVDTARHHFAAWKSLADELVISFTEEDNERLKGVSRVDSLDYILQKGNLILDSATKLQLMEKKNTLYLEMAAATASTDVLPGVVSLMDEMAASGIKIGLGSSSKNARSILDKLQLTSRFSTIVDGNNITLSKPDPEVFLKAAAAMNVAPEDCLVIEDAQSGVEAAITGGFYAIGVGKDLELAHAQLESLEGQTMERIFEFAAMKQQSIKDEWSIGFEGWEPASVRSLESLLSIGNGRFGQRANFEEHYSGDRLQGSYLAGVYYPDKTRVGWWKKRLSGILRQGSEFNQLDWN